MAGIYVHVPFCSSRCIYCDFYSTTNGDDWKKSYVQALCRELRHRQHELAGQEVATVYFGGGTPSLLSVSGLREILETLRECYVLVDHPEITLESNPDDVTAALARDWWQMGFNRVSLGVQTFNDDILRILRRRHTAATAEAAVQLLREAGFSNLTLDLIYGLPNQNFDIWKNDVQRILSLPIQHLSAYALSYEGGTVLTRMRDSGQIQEADEETVRQMYLHLIEATRAAGFTHYEISNFALPGYESRHNSSYWSGTPYLGVGPGAHSYDGHCCRRANLPDLKAYVAALDDAPHEMEMLDEGQLFEEYLLTGLRTAKGISMDVIEARFGHRVRYRTECLAKRHLTEGNLQVEDSRLWLTLKGILISDYIISDLMLAGDE